MQARSRNTRKGKGLVQSLRSVPRPTPQQAALIAVLVLVIALVLWRVVGLVGEFSEVRAARKEMEAKRLTLEERHRDLERQAQFVSDPDNLEQELRSRYNYKRPGENVIVIVPPKGVSTTTSTDE